MTMTQQCCYPFCLGLPEWTESCDQEDKQKAEREMATVGDKRFNSFMTEDEAEKYVVSCIPKNTKINNQVGIAQLRRVTGS